MDFTKNKSRTPFIKMRINGEYDNFTDYFEENKKEIYLNIIKTFEGFLNNRKKILTIYIYGIISLYSWESEIKINRSDIDFLIENLIPYFENIEDYETCGKVVELYNNLKKN